MYSYTYEIYGIKIGKYREIEIRERREGEREREK